MSGIEILALILIVLITVKLVVLLIKPDILFGMAKKVYLHPALVQFVALVLAAAVGYYLKVSGISLVEIMAVLVLAMLFMVVTIAPYEKKLVDEARQMFEHGEFWHKNWVGFLLWMALAFWTAYQLLQNVG